MEIQVPDNFSVASVTVAHNGAAILRRHLESLRSQSRSLDEIIVVDNASTDETRDLLSTQYPEVKQLYLPTNVGIAGGLAVGLAGASFEKRHDWIWIFDQDSVPAPDALEQLLTAFQHVNSSGNTAILAPTCVHRATGQKYPGLKWSRFGFAPHPQAEEQPISLIDMAISSGSLIRRLAIEEVGLPREDFFMDFVDYEYCLRLRCRGFQIAMVRDSILEHAIGEPTTLHFLGRQRSWSDHSPWREYYMARNEVFTIWQYRKNLAARVFVIYRLAHHALGVLAFGKSKLRCLAMICRGVIDGRAGRLGIRVLPEVNDHSATIPRDAMGTLANTAADR